MTLKLKQECVIHRHQYNKTADISGNKFIFIVKY